MPTLHPSTAVSKGSAAALAQLCWPLLSLSLSAFTTTNSEICTSVLKWKAAKFFPFIHPLGSFFSFITRFFFSFGEMVGCLVVPLWKNLFLVFTACSINSYLAPEPPTLLPQSSFSPQFPTGLFSSLLPLSPVAAGFLKLIYNHTLSAWAPPFPLPWIMSSFSISSLFWLSSLCGSYWTVFIFCAFPVLLVFQLVLMTPFESISSWLTFSTLKGTARRSWPLLAQRQQ